MTDGPAVQLSLDAVPEWATGWIGPPNARGGLRPLPSFGAAAPGEDAGRVGSGVGGPRSAAAALGSHSRAEEPGAPGGCGRPWWVLAPINIFSSSWSRRSGHSPDTSRAGSNTWSGVPAARRRSKAALRRPPGEPLGGCRPPGVAPRGERAKRRDCDWLPSMVELGRCWRPEGTTDS
ncbi:hypothetical protein NDU88_001765 [Pleurodeles waltl]|uniref:Uncharacterized protein n=1 Tax=Pleurodeles waltl TaxID=8319 RepID=A0AAV7TIP3_PLEWA|nr:hypothetical protein NDU88_001765 [Pleurodeles waltl]